MATPKIDIYVANDTTNNFYYVNQGNGTFVESAVQSGIATDGHGDTTGKHGGLFCRFRQ